MKKILLIAMILLFASICEGQTIQYDSTAQMPYVEVQPVYWTPVSNNPVRRLYVKLISYDMVRTARIGWQLRDSTNYTTVYSGENVLPITTHSIDSARVIVFNYLVNIVIVDTAGNPVLSYAP